MLLAVPVFLPSMRDAAVHGWPFFVLYIQNISLHLRIPYGLEPTWSLAVEEQYYMTWPLLIFLFKRRILVGLLIFFIFLSLLLRILGYGYGASLWFTHNFTFCRLDAVACGSLAALWLRSSDCTAIGWRKRAYQAMGTGFAGTILARILFNDQSSFISYTFIALGFVGFLGLVLISDTQKSILGRALDLSFLRYTGKISYGLYLVHMPVFMCVRYLVIQQHLMRTESVAGNALAASAQFGLAFLIAALSWRFLESPLLRLKRFFPSGSIAYLPVEGGLGDVAR